MDLLSILIGLLSIIIIGIIWKVTKNYGTLETLKIPLMKPFLCFGSPPFDWHNVSWHEWFSSQHQKFGLTFGQYVGSIPYINTIDPDIIKEVYVKNFEVFGDMVDNPNYDDKMKTIDLAQGSDWKNIRKVLSPTFTSGKLKGMLEPMTDVAEKAMNHLDKLVEKNEPIAMKNFFQGYSIDTICRCAFGIETNAYEDSEHQLIKQGRAIIQGFQVTNWMDTIGFLLFYLFPGLEATFPTLMYPEAFFKMHDVTDDLVKKRKESKTHFGDFVDKIIEVCNDANSPVTEDMIKSQGAIFFTAGFETTANTMTTLCYNLAVHKNVQEKLIEEIDSIETIDHDTITDLHYLEAAINENLRMYPPAHVQERICKKNTELKGMKVTKGTYIRMSIYAAHRNPDFFPEPDEFRPERFLKENQDDVIPYTFRAFSGGPRICLGQRFAMVEMKICIAKILKKFRIEKCEDTKLDFKKGDPFILTYDEVFLKLVPRE